MLFVSYCSEAPVVDVLPHLCFRGREENNSCCGFYKCCYCWYAAIASFLWFNDAWKRFDIFQKVELCNWKYSFFLSFTFQLLAPLRFLKLPQGKLKQLISQERVLNPLFIHMSDFSFTSAEQRLCSLEQLPGVQWCGWAVHVHLWGWEKGQWFERDLKDMTKKSDINAKCLCYMCRRTVLPAVRCHRTCSFHLQLNCRRFSTTWLRMLLCESQFSVMFICFPFI